MVAHTFNPSTREQKQVYLCEFEVSLVHAVSSRVARDRYIVRPCLKQQQRKWWVEARLAA